MLGLNSHLIGDHSGSGSGSAAEEIGYRLLGYAALRGEVPQSPVFFPDGGLDVLFIEGGS